jgi:hypothetical protein
MGTLFCLLALVVQLTLPVAQTWHIATELADGSAEDHVLPWFLGSVSDSRARIETDASPQHAPNAPTWCPLCQSFLRIRDFVVTQPVGVAASAVSSWLVPLSTMHADHLALHVSAPRAPPFLS